MRKTNRSRLRGSWLLAGTAAIAAILQINWNCAPGASANGDDAQDLAMLGILTPGNTENVDDLDLSDPAQVDAFFRSMATADDLAAEADMRAMEAREAVDDGVPETTGSANTTATPANTQADVHATAAARLAAYPSGPAPKLATRVARDHWGPGGVPLNAGSQPYKNSNGYLPVLLERVTYCSELRWPKRLNLCKNWHTPGEYSAWTAAGVSKGKRKDTYIARLTPWVSKSQTEFLVFTAAGQQPPGNGVDNGVTGQWAGYKSAFEKTTGARWVVMDNNSMMRKAMEAKTAAGNKLFDVNKTFMASAYDTKFNQLVFAHNKQRMENAYFNWLKSKVDPAKLKLIYLGGSSRGGCLVLRLAKRFRADPQFKNTPLILQSFDGTCSKIDTVYDDMLNITWAPVSNPISPIYLESAHRFRSGFYLNLPAHFPNRSRLAIRHIVSGDHVVVPTVRPWAYRNRNYNAGWFRQKWLPYLHKTIGRKYEVSADTIDPMVAHLKQYYPHLIAPPSGPIGTGVGVGSPIGPAIDTGGTGVIGEIEAAPAELAPAGGTVGGFGSLEASPALPGLAGGG